VFNLLLQFMLGLDLEMVNGTLRITVFYVLGVRIEGEIDQESSPQVLSSSLAFFCFDCGSLLGASGGLYCLIAASLTTSFLNWSEYHAIFFTR
jgi:membrane associated rhomboid family serine protease